MEKKKIQIEKKQYKYILLCLTLCLVIAVSVGLYFSKKNERINILFMGIDKDVPMTERYPETNSIGQADVVFLVSMDTKGKDIDIVAIPRDTMVNVEKYTSSGKYLGNEQLQICLQYAYADGTLKSCELMQDRVLEIFEDIEIDAYVALNFTGIMAINDAVGGVEVTMQDDYTIFNPLFVKGETVLLQGSDALAFIQRRDTSVAHTAYTRIERQKQYLEAFIKQAKAAIKENPQIITELYTVLKDDMVTNLELDDILNIANTAMNTSLDKIEFHTIRGEIINDGTYECFYPDKEHLQELMQLMN